MCMLLPPVPGLFPNDHDLTKLSKQTGGPPRAVPGAVDADRRGDAREGRGGTGRAGGETSPPGTTNVNSAVAPLGPLHSALT